MTRVFADTSYYIALLLPKDHRHELAVNLSAELDQQIVTTTGVLAELGNFFSYPGGRDGFIAVVASIHLDVDVLVIDLDLELFSRAFELFSGRPDKLWSIVDCASFQVMRDYGLTEALTTDHHFEQAGFTALLK